MKIRPIAFSLSAAAFAAALLSSCDKESQERLDDTGSPATKASPSVPIPPQTEPDKTDTDPE